MKDDLNHPPLVLSIEHSPIADIFHKYNTNLRLANFEVLQSLVKPRCDISPIYNGKKAGSFVDNLKAHPFHLTQFWGPDVEPWGNYSSPTFPHFIYDGGASDCTVLMSVKADGSALTFHHSFYADKPERMTEILKIYKNKVTDLIGSDCLTIITGTNIQWLEDPGPAKDEFLQNILYSLADLQPQLLVTKQSPNQKLFTSLPPTTKKIYGMALLPKQFSATNMNECMLFTDNTMDQERLIRNRYRL